MEVLSNRDKPRSKAVQFEVAHDARDPFRDARMSSAPKKDPGYDELPTPNCRLFSFYSSEQEIEAHCSDSSEYIIKPREILSMAISIHNRWVLDAVISIIAIQRAFEAKERAQRVGRKWIRLKGLLAVQWGREADPVDWRKG